MKYLSVIPLLMAATMTAVGEEPPALPGSIPRNLPSNGVPAGTLPTPVPPAGPVPVPDSEAVAQSAERALDAKFREVFDDVILPNGLVLDRRSDRNTVSCAATGFTAYALALMVQRGTADPATTTTLLRRGFETTLAANPERNRGWLYHFTDAVGQGKPWSEVSTIDSALFYLGFLRAAETLDDAALLAEVRQAIQHVDTQWLMKDGYFIHGLYWSGTRERRLPYTWDDTSEGVLLYRLFDLPFKPRITRHDYPLFVYYYPICFFDDPDYATKLGEAVKYQIDHYGYTGITAADGPEGYQADDPFVISPLALYAVSALVPAARETLAEYPVDRMVPAYHVGSGWIAPDRVTIDYGSAYILLVKSEPGAQSEPVVNLKMK